MTKLLRYCLETTRTITKNTDRPRNHIYQQEMKQTTYTERNQVLQDDSPSFTG